MSSCFPISLCPDPAADTAVAVRAAYAPAIAFSQDERWAFQAAARAWRERNPNATVEEARRAVAAIICGKRI